MRTAKLITAAGLLVAASVIGGTLIGGVLAAPRAGTDAGTVSDMDSGFVLGGESGEYCDVFLDTLASELGVDADLLQASKAAAIAAIDAAVAGGDLDEDRAAQLKERINDIDEAGCGFIGAPGRAFVHGFGHGLVSADVLDAAADALNLSSAELLGKLADGSSLEEMAGDQGVAYDTVKSAVMDALQADLDAAVAEGLDQERADTIADRVQTWLDDGGKPGPGRFFGRFHGGSGPLDNGPAVDSPLFQSQ